MICKVESDKNIIEFSLVRKERKKIAISVHPDKSVLVSAPHKVPLPSIKQAVKKRLRWIEKQKHYFDTFLPKQPDRKYVGGETHHYLGRSYRLKVNSACDGSVKLKGQYIFVSHKDPAKIKSLMYEWYANRANKYFNRLCGELFEPMKKYNLEKPEIIIKRLKSRWGSCMPSENRITLNLELIKSPRDCI